MNEVHPRDAVPPTTGKHVPGPFAIVLVVHGVATWESDAANRFYDILSLVCVERAVPAPFGTIHGLFFVSFSWRPERWTNRPSSRIVYSNCWEDGGDE